MKKSTYQNIKIFLGVAFLLATPVVALAAVASSTNYQLERDSINIGGLLSTTTNYTLEDTVGELASGTSSSASFFLKAGYQQMDASYITITSPADLALTPAISEDTGGTANGNTSWTVTTNNPAGYTLSIRAASSPAMQSSSASFSDYTISSVADFTWSVGSSERKFGFTPEGSHITTRYKDNGSVCNITSGSDTASACWDGLSTSNVVIAQSSQRNDTNGTATTVRFRAEAGSTNQPPDGNYSATVVLTAITQ